MSMTDRDFLDTYGGDRHPPFKFVNVGDTIKGTVTEKPRVVDTKNMNTNADEKKMVVAVTDDNGETWSVWIKAGFSASAIKEALTTAKADGLEAGGAFAMQLIELRDMGKPQPAKVYKAQYRAPVTNTAVGVEELL